MTTVCFDGETLASDSRMHGDKEYYQDNCKKIFKVGASYIGIAGDVSEGLLFLRWRKDMTKEKPELTDAFDALEIKDGIAYQWDKYLILLELGKTAAIGSGCQFAIAAMECGKTAKEAIEVAKKFDSGTGGKVKAVKIK